MQPLNRLVCLVLSTSGGHSPSNIGNFSDGVINVLDAMSEPNGFEYDGSDMPWPVYPDGVVP